MKNQYFGDVNDYRKYGLLRQILRASEANLLVAWMLTPDDDSTDGKFISYLGQAGKWAHYDPELYSGLRYLVEAGPRAASSLESTDLLPGARYFSDVVPDSAPDRLQWFESLKHAASDADMIFLDPDNGLEVKSKPHGRKGSSKFLFWREVEELWNQGKSLVIYQHFIREQRSAFTKRIIDRLERQTPGSQIAAFTTPHVLFLVALQPAHHSALNRIHTYVGHGWGSQINVFEY